MLFGEHWLQHNNRLPVGVLTCADDGPGSGVETCLNDLNITVRFIETMPVSMSHGAWLLRNPSWRTVPEGGPYTVKNNRDSLRWLFSMSRRVAEYSLMLKLTKEVLGDVYQREFMGRYHDPWGADEDWAWKRLDKEDEEYMMNLPIEMKLPESLSGGPQQWTSPEGLGPTLQVMFLLTVLSLAPAVLLMIALSVMRK